MQISGVIEWVASEFEEGAGDLILGSIELSEEGASLIGVIPGRIDLKSVNDPNIWMISRRPVVSIFREEDPFEVRHRGRWVEALAH